MRNLAFVLIAVMALTVIGCQPPEGMGGVSQEQFDELKTKVESMETDMGEIQAALDSLTSVYNDHIDKFHKSGGKKAPTGGGKKPKPPTQK